MKIQNCSNIATIEVLDQPYTFSELYMNTDIENDCRLSGIVRFDLNEINTYQINNSSADPVVDTFLTQLVDKLVGDGIGVLLNEIELKVVGFSEEGEIYIQISGKFELGSVEYVGDDDEFIARLIALEEAGDTTIKSVRDLIKNGLGPVEPEETEDQE